MKATRAVPAAVGETPGDTPEAPSRSQRKRERHALQALGEALARLDAGRRAALPLSPELREAVGLAAKLERGAFRRQVRYIGGLLAREDADAIRSALDGSRRGTREETDRFHRLERWRDRLLAGGEPVVAELLALAPSVDARRLRGLVQSARTGSPAGSARRASRALFRYLREVEEI